MAALRCTNREKTQQQFVPDLPWGHQVLSRLLFGLSAVWLLISVLLIAWVLIGFRLLGQLLASPKLLEPAGEYMQKLLPSTPRLPWMHCTEQIQEQCHCLSELLHPTGASSTYEVWPAPSSWAVAMFKGQMSQPQADMLARQILASPYTRPNGEGNLNGAAFGKTCEPRIACLPRSASVVMHLPWLRSAVAIQLCSGAGGWVTQFTDRGAKELFGGGAPAACRPLLAPAVGGQPDTVSESALQTSIWLCSSQSGSSRGLLPAPGAMPGSLTPWSAQMARVLLNGTGMTPSVREACSLLHVLGALQCEHCRGCQPLLMSNWHTSACQLPLISNA